MTRLFTTGIEMGDLLDFTTISSGSVSSSEHRSGNYCLSLTGSAYVTKTFAAASEVFIRFALKRSSWTDTGSSHIVLRSGTSVQFQLKWSASSTVGVYVNTTLVANGSITLQPNTWYLFEIRYLEADSTGRIQVKIDGVMDIDYGPADTKPSTLTTVDNLYLGGPVGPAYYDDIAINDTNGSVDNSWCGDGHVLAYVPNGNGDVSQLTGSDNNSTDNYALVDEIPTGSSPDDYVQDTSVDQYDLYQITNTGWSGGVSISRAWVEGRGLDVNADGGKCQLGIKPSGGSESWSSDITLLTSLTAIKSSEYLVNPLDSGAWEPADIDSLQIGFKGR